MVVVSTTFRLADEFKMPNDARFRSTRAFWMINAFEHDNVFEIEGA